MKTANLQIVDIDGNVVNEKTIELKEGSNLIIKVPEHYSSMPEFVDVIAETFWKKLGTGEVIFIPQDIELYVLNVKVL